jgi:hypothetical protein
MKYLYDAICIYFTKSLWHRWLLIGLVSIIVQSLLRYLANDWALPRLWHIIGWSIWTLICIIMIFVNQQKINKKYLN